MIARRKGLWAPALVVGLWLLAGGGSFAATVDPACKAWPGIDEKAVNAFLDHFCYLGWQHDAQVRNTGPFIHRDGDKVLNFGVHPAVRIYYSPDLWKWMKGGRKGKPGARSMLVKEQFNPPAQLYAGMSDAEIKKQVNEWTVMVYAPEAAADGWYWVDHSPPGPEPSGGGKKKAPSFESRVSNELQYPSTGLGLYCLNCHASAVSEQTFATVRNVEGSPITYLYVPPKPGPTKPPHGTFAAGFHDAIAHEARLPHPKLTKPLVGPSKPFLAQYPEILPVPAKEVEANAAMPPETYDHVVMPPHPKAVQFITSDQCVGCHDAGIPPDYHPAMMFPDERTGQTVNLSQYGEWRASMMGLAGRDPIFFAQLESEGRLHPAQSTGLQNLCLSCHGAMGQRQFAFDTDGKTLFTRAQVNAYSKKLDENIKPPFKYGALAREGISCDICHHISPEGLGTPASYSGQFKLGPPNEIYGPYSY